MFDIKEVEKLYPGAGGLMLEPQLIHKSTDSQLKSCDDGTWFAQLKKDGALYMFVKGLEGQTYLFGRTIFEKYPIARNEIELAEAWESNIYGNIGIALRSGEEGMVVKKKTALYEPGKRPQTMLKAKQVDYIDAVIIGFKDPEVHYTGKEIETWQYWVNGYDGSHLPVGYHYGEDIADPVTKHYYYGWKNAIEIGAYDENGNIHSIGTIASGLTDFMREDMTKYPENYIYKVCEIQCMMKDNKEQTLRHGFFLRIREDKNPTECLLSEIFK